MGGVLCPPRDNPHDVLDLEQQTRVNTFHNQLKAPTPDSFQEASRTNADVNQRGRPRAAKLTDSRLRLFASTPHGIIRMPSPPPPEGPGAPREYSRHKSLRP